MSEDRVGHGQQDQLSEVKDKLQALSETRTAPPSAASLELPIKAHAQEIKDVAQHYDSFVVIGETGSGKTTQLPLILRETMSEEDKIAITQPRRVAARSVARYVAEQAGSRVGDEVGYNVRFEDRTTEGTRINFMTDGILLRKMQEDPLLQEYTAVMVDEVHERSLNIDFTLGLLKRLQTKRQEAGLPPLKIMVTSATLEKEKLADYFDGSPVVEVPGRLHPVEVHYEERTPVDYTAAVAQKVQMISQGGKEGDILIFMPGAEEINQTIQKIQALGLKDVDILPLHGQLSPEDQDRIFAPGSRRKIIVSTNVAETSVTVPGVRHVVDSGLIKQVEFDPQTGIESLNVRPHAKSGCVQRAGRAGRVAPGDCYRLYSEDDFNRRSAFQLPEILRSNLAHVVLTMKKIGIEDIEGFDFIDPPDAQTLRQAVNTLKALGALDEQGQMTEIGRIMSELPLEPKIARMVIEAERHGCTEQVCTIAAFLGGRSVFSRPREREREADAAHSQFQVQGSDFLTVLNVWKQYEGQRFNERWARDNFLNAKTLGEVREVRNQLFRALKRNGIRAAENEDPEAIGKSIAAGLIEDLMEYSSRHAYRRVKDDTTGYYIHPSSVTFGGDPRYIVPAEIMRTSKTFARVCQVVKPEWIRDIAPQLIREEARTASYDPTSDQIVRSYDLYLKGSYNSYASESRQLTGEEAVGVFANALASERVDLPFVQQNKQVLATLRDLHIRSGGETPAALSSTQLAEIYKQRLGAFASRKELAAALEAGQVDLALNLDEYIPAETREQILRDNPDAIQIGDKDYALSYADSGWGSDRFTVKIRVPASGIFAVQEMPQIPSGRAITIEIVDKEGSTYGQFSGKDLEELKKKSRDYLIRQQYDTWRYSQQSTALEQRIDQFDPTTSENPAMPEKVAFGTDPETGEPIYAYPAMSVEQSYYSGNRYSIKFYPTEQEAQQAQAKVEDVRTQAREKQRIEQERTELLPVVRTQYTEVQSMLGGITYSNYEAQGFTYDEYRMMNDQLRQASYRIDQDPRAAQQALNEIQEKVRAKQQARVEQQQQLEAALQTVQPRLDTIRQRVASLNELTAGYSSYSSPLPAGAQELVQRWQALERDISQGKADPAEVERISAELEAQAGQLNPRLLKDYIETTTQKNWGIYGKVDVQNGQVFAVNSYGEREPIQSIEIGRSGRTFYISRGRNGEMVFKPSGQWGPEITLQPGSYAIGRDGSYAYSVKFNDRGEVEQIFGKPIGYMQEEDETERTARQQEEQRAQAAEMQNRATPLATAEATEPPAPLEDAELEALVDQFNARRRGGRQTEEDEQRARRTEAQRSLIERTLSGQTTRTEQPQAQTSMLGAIQARETADLVQEVEGLMQRNSKPRKRALIQAALIGRGPEAITQAKIPESEFPTIFQQLRQARQEAASGFNVPAQEELDQTIRQTENMYAVLKASRTEDVKGYIGAEDKEGLRRFQDILLNLLQGREKLPKDDEMPELIDQALEQMTI